MSRFAISALSFVLSFTAHWPAAYAQHADEHAGALDEVGSASVQFETSCVPAVQAEFNRAVALLHSFWFSQARATFEAVLAKDPACAIAYWGIALSHWGNPFAGLRAPQQIELGGAAIQHARRTGSPSARERAYIDAATELFRDDNAATQRARTTAYEQAMEKLTRNYPQDVEARIFYALAANQTADPADKSYAQQLKAAAILEPLFVAHPKHPGLAHYIIHAYDHPPLAEKALHAARQYASLAPAVPHALHMPSHTFTRMGLWKESIETNRRSAEAARKHGSPGEELHALDYQVYAYLQIAQDHEAKRVMEQALKLVEGADGIAIGGAGVGAFAIAAIPARYALERGAWQEAADLPVRPTRTAYTEAMTRFARAIGAARSGKSTAAKEDIERLAVLRDSLKANLDAYWAEQVDIQRRVALAWVAYAEGKRDEGIAQLRGAADAEDATDKSAISPGPLAPARELLGYMLLEAGKPREALTAFESTIKKEPNRFRGLYGAARAAEAAGDADAAKKFYRELLQVAVDADEQRPELRNAKEYVGRG